MKATLHIETNRPEKISLLIKVAKEMGIEISNDANSYSENIINEFSAVSEPSLAETWESKEDERWDELYK